jgi:uncharacterized protein YydD (DUF2326 family)
MEWRNKEMFLKNLIIQNGNKIIRDIKFHKGVNFIVDETSKNANPQTTGNNVGKTTVLRLIDFCFGGKGENIYKDTEFKKQPNTNVENFLKENDIVITMNLIENMEDINSNKITIRRNFSARKKKIQEINGKQFNDSEFDSELKKIIFNSDVEKPAFRQIISKNIRDEKNRMDNILKTLNQYTRSEEYETLFLFWLGIELDESSEKYKLLEDKRAEEKLRKRLEKTGNLSLIEQNIVLINRKIEELNKQKEIFNFNANYTEDIIKLNNVKERLNKLSSELGKLEFRKSLIIENKQELENEYSNINVSSIEMLYNRAKILVPNIQKTFEDTLKFHNSLISEKLEFITKELPNIENSIKVNKNEIESLIAKEQELDNILRKNGFVEDMEKIIVELNKQHEKKGQFEEQKRMLQESEESLGSITERLSKIDSNINSKDSLIEERITEFNKYFSEISNKLYEENYLLSSSKNEKGYELIVTHVEGNPSTGKKKGQIAAFDFAYIMFADKLDIKCLHFILHDKIENIHDNQLNTLIEMANSINGQYIVSVLRDKIPTNIDVSSFEILKLSQDDKLFKI